MGSTGISGAYNASGQSVLTSVSGNVVSISGTATVAGAVTTSISGNVVSVSGLWASTTLQSGQVGVSGAVGVLGFMYDYSGLNWAPMPTAASGVRTLHITASGDAFTTSVSGNVVSISGTATIAGAVTTSISGNFVALGSGSVLGLSGLILALSGLPVSVSGNTVTATATANISGQSVFLGSGSVLGLSGLIIGLSGLSVAQASGATVIAKVSGEVVNISGQTVDPVIPTFINAPATFRINSASGGIRLSSFSCVSCTVRNIGNSGDVIYVGSLSSPPFVGYFRSSLARRKRFGLLVEGWRWYNT